MYPRLSTLLICTSCWQSRIWTLTDQVASVDQCLTKSEWTPQIRTFYLRQNHEEPWWWTLSLSLSLSNRGTFYRMLVDQGLCWRVFEIWVYQKCFMLLYACGESLGCGDNIFLDQIAESWSTAISQSGKPHNVFLHQFSWTICRSWSTFSLDQISPIQL